MDKPEWTEYPLLPYPPPRKLTPLEASWWIRSWKVRVLIRIFFMEWPEIYVVGIFTLFFAHMIFRIIQIKYL